MVTELTPGHICVVIGKKKAKIYGELLVPMAPGDPDYVLYTRTIKRWDSPDEEIDDQAKAAILNDIQQHFDKNRLVLEYDDQVG